MNFYDFTDYLNRIVGKYDGFIEKYAGDAVMASGTIADYRFLILLATGLKLMFIEAGLWIKQ